MDYVSPPFFSNDNRELQTLRTFKNACTLLICENGQLFNFKHLFFIYCAPSDYRSPNIEKNILKIYVKREFTSFVLLFSPFWEAAEGHTIS